MVERALKLKIPLCMALSEIPELHPLTFVEWEITEACTVTLSDQNYSTAAMIILTIRSVANHSKSLVLRSNKVLKVCLIN